MLGPDTPGPWSPLQVLVGAQDTVGGQGAPICELVDFDLHIMTSAKVLGARTPRERSTMGQAGRTGPFVAVTSQGAIVRAFRGAQ